VRDWRIEEIQNQIRFRDLNEITGSYRRVGSGGPLHTYVCECGDGSCRTSIRLTQEEYEDVRTGPARFAIAPDHENPELEDLVAEGDRYSIIDTLPGFWRDMVCDADPRNVN
jgi:hypothetical protein